MTESINIRETRLAIAKHRFPFPNGEKPAWRTYVNDDKNPLTGLLNIDSDVYPDILVVDRATTTNKYIMAASINIEEPNAEDITRWRQISNAVDFFYVFVPKGHCQQAADLANTGDVKVDGFRWFSGSGESIEISDCF